MDGSETIGNGGAFNLDFGSSSDANRASDFAVNPDFGRSDDNHSDGNFDPSRHAGRDKRNRDGSYRLKRGRKPGSGNNGGTTRRTSAASAASVEALSRLLVVVHAGFAAATKTPEMNLDEADANALGKATANVLDQFDIRPDPKVEAIVGLVIVAGSVYGPKIYMVRERRKEEKAAKKDEEPQAQPLRFSSVRVDG